jgi:hypothetical protein
VSVSIALLGWLSLVPTLQDKNPAPADGQKIVEAVKKGVEYLRSQEKVCLKPSDYVSKSLTPRELVLWTFVSAGVSPKDPLYKKLFEDMVKDHLVTTYQVALQAMILEFLDRVRFQFRIAQCAQFMVDNQNPAGQWGYGSPSIYVEDLLSKPGEKPIPKAPLTLPDLPQNPKVVRKFAVKKERDGEGGDSSNTYFAALGLRAANDAGILFEKAVIELAVRCWRESRAGKAEDSGWNYDRWNTGPYPAATAAAVSSLLIYGNIQGTNLKKDSIVLGGASALAKSWNGGALASMNGGDAGLFQFYGLYSVEVAGLFLGQEKLGDHDWYAEGAKLLLEQQKSDGSWESGADVVRAGGAAGVRAMYVNNTLWDTSFAVLFLAKGIRPLQDPPAKKK